MFSKVTNWAKDQADKLGEAINVERSEPKKDDVDSEAECPGTELERGIAWSYAADAADQAVAKIGSVIDHAVNEAGDTYDTVAAGLNERLDTIGENAIRVVPVCGVQAVREAEDHAEEAWTAAGRMWRRGRATVAKKLAAAARVVHPGADDAQLVERDVMDQSKRQFLTNPSNNK